MKRLLVATTAIVIAWWATPRPAHALFGVGDICANCATEWSQIASWAKQAADMARDYSQFVQANSSLTGIVGSLSGAAGVDTSGLTSVRSVLSDVGQIQGAISGTMSMVNGGFNGGLSLSGAANAILNQNTVYRPTGGDFMAQWINARAQGQAAQQAYMQEFVRSGQARLQALQDLKSRQMTATTTDERMAIQNEIGRTQEELSTQAMQAQQIAALSEMQGKVSQQQLLEKQRADSEALQKSTQSYADAVGLNPGWTGSGTGTGTLSAAAMPVVAKPAASAGSPLFVPTFNVSAN